MKTIELINKLKSDRIAAKKKFYKNTELRQAFRDNKEKPGDFKDKTFLYIRATDTDLGARPLPSETVFWNSPDIELYDSLGIQIATNQLELNKNFVIKVLVHNDGDMNCNSCIVELFICNPSIGFDRSHATQIGIQSISISGHSNAMANFNFTPGNTNLGHQCLFARAYSYVSADIPSSADQFNTVLDRHIGQQNISVINQGTTFDFFIVNKFQQRNYILKLLQIKKSLENNKLHEISKLKITNRNIPINNFVLKRNLDIINIDAIPNHINYHVISTIRTTRRRPEFEKINFDNIRNIWEDNFDRGLHKISLEIPNLNLKKDQATKFEIKLIDPITGVVNGGITLIVKG